MAARRGARSTRRSSRSGSSSSSPKKQSQPVGIQDITSGGIADIEFIETMKPLLALRELDESDLQVNVKKCDVGRIIGPDVENDFIGRNWYSLGLSKGIKRAMLDEIKEDNDNLVEKKDALLHLLIEPQYQIRYEDIVYFHYKEDKESQFITRILDFLVNQRRKTEPYRPVHEEDKKPQSHNIKRPWQAFYNKRLKNPPISGLRQELSPENYQKQFYDTLWYEEEEHIKKLDKKCNGCYKFFISDDVPPEVKELLLQPDRYKEFGYIEDGTFTDDKVEYATQASEGVHLYKSNDFHVCKASISQHNHSHVEQRLYLCLPGGTKGKLEARPSCNRGRYFEVTARFEVKHSYFNNLHHAVVILPSYVTSSLLPDEHSFSRLEEKFNCFWSRYKFMELDKGDQTRALQMITSVSSKHNIQSCPPPVILYGPFGSGKTRILARAAYEIMTNGIERGDPFTRILICAHHPQSVNSFIVDYFVRIEKEEGKLKYDVFLVSRYSGNPYPSSPSNSHFYKTFDELYNSTSKLNNVIIVASYNASLSLHDIFNVPDYDCGYFNYVFLDEAAQVREPEAITPLALATRKAKIVLAGDDKQVGPRTLVLGEEAQKFGLDVSLLTRLTERYKEMGSIAATYMTSLTVNYRAHESLLSLPELFYGKLHASDKKPIWHHKGPSGYRFVCSDSRLVPKCVTVNKEQQLVEACIVLEQALLYFKETEQERKPPQICIISSTRKQLNHIKQMVSRYPCYESLREKKVKFLPSFMIQGHEFQAIFLCLLEPLEDGKIKEYFTKSLFNHFVFNTVITRAKSLVVAVGKPLELLEFEDKYISDAANEVKCWHEYLKVSTNSNLQPEIQEEFGRRLTAYKRKAQHEEASAPIPDFDPLYQSQLEKYFEKICVLGKGGFGVVYHVSHKLDKREYAIKKIPTRSGKVMREVLALSQLEHPGIIRYFNSFIERAPIGWDEGNETDESSISLYESNSTSMETIPSNSTGACAISNSTVSFRNEKSQSYTSTEETLTDETTQSSTIGGSNEFLFIQMQLCKKETLKDWLSDHTHISDRCRIVVINYFEQILDAVIYIHKENFIHRDLKPSNILFTMDDKIKVGDFGLVTQNSRIVKQSASQTGSQGFHTGKIGSSLYVSPEQLTDVNYDEKVDIYSLGVILFELYIPFGTEMERIEVLKNIKKYLHEFQAIHKHEAKLVTLMISPITTRPPASEVKEAFDKIKAEAELNDSFILPKI